MMDQHSHVQLLMHSCIDASSFADGDCNRFDDTVPFELWKTRCSNDDNNLILIWLTQVNDLFLPPRADMSHLNVLTLSPVHEEEVISSSCQPSDCLVDANCL